MPTGPPTLLRASQTRARQVTIDSLLHPQAVLIRRLLTRAEPEASGAILIDDEDNILQALRAGMTVRAVFHCGDPGLSTALRRRLPHDAAIHAVAKRTCKKLFGSDRVSRLFAVADAPPRRSLASLASMPRDIVALDRVRIAGNAGAIVRTSLAMGAGAVVLLDTDLDLHDRRLVRASRGYAFALPVLTATAAELIEFCRRNDRPLAVATPRAVTPVDGISSLARGLVLAFGAEKHGCSRALLDAAAHEFSIVTSRAVESLNVSAAVAMTLYCRAAASL